MPRTFITFTCGAAALSGLPLLSGFFSKDEILFVAFTSQHAGHAPMIIAFALGIGFDTLLTNSPREALRDESIVVQ